ncbi:MAG: trypsin-like peptidase domain-containing protein [bacterium]
MSRPDIFEAGVLEDGQVCPCCQEPVAEGQRVGRCPTCHHLQHETCWEGAGACCSYQCRGEASEPAAGPRLVITPEDVAEARVRVSPRELAASRAEPPRGATRLSTLAVTAFVFALVGIVALGWPGLLAVVLGALAIGAINTRRDLRGLGFAGAAIVIGVLDVVGWGAAGAVLLMTRGDLFEKSAPVIPPGRAFVEPSDMDALPPPVRRAIRANVLVVRKRGLGAAEGSGVILEQRGDRALIVTNRHVIQGGGRIEVTFFDGHEASAGVVWQAPSGIDAAVLSCDPGQSETERVPVRVEPAIVISETVFAIGNPVGLAWSYGKGVVSAIRKQSYGAGTLRMIQTQTPLNPGNSGGGLYDELGNLVGINTMIMGKPGTQGIGFAIAIADLVPLLEGQAGVQLLRAKETSEDPGP